MTTLFAEVRERIPAQTAAEHYGVDVRQGWCRCPFHGGGMERTPSLKFYADGSFHCFGCHAGGDSIRFTRLLFGLEPMAAVRKLNDDFGLGLSIGVKLSRSERRQAAQEAKHRAELRETHQQFEEWRTDTIQQLSQVHLVGHRVLQHINSLDDISGLSNSEALAIRWMEWAADLADVLMGSGMEKIMAVWRDREKVKQRCNMILSDTQAKLQTA